jgi:hypothetical protein
VLGRPPNAVPRQGSLVESVRLIFVTVFAAAGYTVATRMATSPSRSAGAERPRGGVPSARRDRRRDRRPLGRESGQAVGYLDDGTMVVVEAAGERIGSDTPIVVRNVIKTATGRMVFANLR